MGTPLGSVVWAPAAAVELGTLSHLPCWLPVLRRGGALTAHPLGALPRPRGHRGGQHLGYRVPGSLGSRRPSSQGQSGRCPAWNGEGGVRSKPPSLAASLFSAFIRRRGWGRGGGALCSQPHTVSHPWQARLSSPPSPTGAAFLHGALGGAGGRGAPSPAAVPCPPGAPPPPRARCRPAWQPAHDR